MREIYSEECTIHCTDKDEELETEVLNFKPKVYLDVSVNRQFKLQFKYNEKHNIYIGSMGGYEFTTAGPEYLG